MARRTYTYPEPGGAQRPPWRMVVTELQHVARLRDGTVDGVLSPGRHRFRPWRDRIVKLSAVPTSLVLPSQEMLTADGVTVRATVALLHRVADPITALRKGDWSQQLYLDIQVALRREVTTATLEDVIANRTDLHAPLLAAAQESAAGLGLEVTKLGIRDLVVPGEQRRLLAQIVEARLAGQAALERTRAETAALRNLANAASLLKDSPELYRLRLLQEIANSSGNTFHIGTEPD